MADDRRPARSAAPRRRFMRRKGCRFCADSSLRIDYKEISHAALFHL